MINRCSQHRAAIIGANRANPKMLVSTMLSKVQNLTVKCVQYDEGLVRKKTLVKVASLNRDVNALLDTGLTISILHAKILKEKRTSDMRSIS